MNEKESLEYLGVFFNGRVRCGDDDNLHRKRL
jgi:hypothetical protein